MNFFFWRTSRRLPLGSRDQIHILRLFYFLHQCHLLIIFLCLLDFREYLFIGPFKLIFCWYYCILCSSCGRFWTNLWITFRVGLWSNLSKLATHISGRLNINLVRCTSIKVTKVTKQSCSKFIPSVNIT